MISCANKILSRSNNILSRRNKLKNKTRMSLPGFRINTPRCDFSKTLCLVVCNGWSKFAYSCIKVKRTGSVAPAVVR